MPTNLWHICIGKQCLGQRESLSFHPLSSFFILFGIFTECQVWIFSLNSLSERGEPSGHQPALAAWVLMDAEWSEQVSDKGSGEGGVGIREMGWGDTGGGCCRQQDQAGSRGGFPWLLNPLGLLSSSRLPHCMKMSCLAFTPNVSFLLSSCPPSLPPFLPSFSFLLFLCENVSSLRARTFSVLPISECPVL